jgi:hypothetical protein
MKRGGVPYVPSEGVVAFTRMCYCEVSTLHSGGHNETAGGTNDLTGDPPAGCLAYRFARSLSYSE